MDRRTILAAGLTAGITTGLAAGAGLIATPLAMPLSLGALQAAPSQKPQAPSEKNSQKKWDPDEGVTAPEDLMKEHGVLNRCLLIYEEGLRRMQSKEPVTPEVFQHTAQMIQKFVEQYHEKNEEQHIFPVFERAKQLVDLVATLKIQHLAGRAVTAQILQLSQPAAFSVADNRTKLAAACRSFIRMYRPHESREDTVLFPALRTILNPKEVEALGDKMEQNEHSVLGDEGFERSVDQVTTLEKQLGIYDLTQFTPKT